MRQQELEENESKQEMETGEKPKANHHVRQKLHDYTWSLPIFSLLIPFCSPVSLSDSCLYLLICFLFLLTFSFQMENRKGKWEEYIKNDLNNFVFKMATKESNIPTLLIIVENQSCSVHLQGHRQGHGKTHRQARFKAEAVKYCTSISIT